MVKDVLSFLLRMVSKGTDKDVINKPKTRNAWPVSWIYFWRRVYACHYSVHEIEGTVIKKEGMQVFVTVGGWDTQTAKHFRHLLGCFVGSADCNCSTSVGSGLEQSVDNELAWHWAERGAQIKIRLRVCKIEI